MQNYSSMKLELLALYWAVAQKYRDLLLGTEFIVFTDNNPLSYLQTTTALLSYLKTTSKIVPDFLCATL